MLTGREAAVLTARLRAGVEARLKAVPAATLTTGLRARLKPRVLNLR